MTDPTDTLTVVPDSTSDEPGAPADHPAKWSQPVLDLLAEYVAAEAELQDRRLRVLDPFAGVGRLRLATALGQAATYSVEGVELQPEWGDEGTLQGDATDLPAEWSGRYDVLATSPCYGNRMADHHQAADRCKTCDGQGCEEGCGQCDMSPSTAGPDAHRQCRTCKGQGLSWRNTYAHSLRRQGGDVVPGSAAVEQWGWRYRDLHQSFIVEAMRVVVEGGLLLVNMSNHLRDGEEQQVVEWWVNQLLHRQCTLVEVRRVGTRRNRKGANRDERVDGEVVIAMRTPGQRRLF